MSPSPLKAKATSPGRTYPAIAGITAMLLGAGLLVPLLGSPQVDRLATRGPGDNGQISGAAPTPGTPGAVIDPTSAVPAATPVGEPSGIGTTTETGTPGAGPAAPAAPQPETPGAGPAAPVAPQPEAPQAAAPPQSGAGQGGSPAAQAGKPLTATDQGVTASSIKVGVVLLDLSAALAIGLGLDNYDTATQKRAFETYFKGINNGGGINGRRIAPVYAEFDPLSTSGAKSAGAICIRMAKDEKVFALMGYTYAAGPCAAVQYRIPVAALNAELESTYRLSKNYFSSSQPSYERTARNWAAFLLDSGLSKGKKVGLLNVKDSGNSELSADAAAATLTQLGQPLAYRAQLTNDQAAASSQLPVEVQKMKAAGVQQVMLNTEFLTAINFMQQAEQQNYFPQYLTSEHGALASNGLIRKGPQRSKENVIGVTAQTVLSPVGRVEPPHEKVCRENYNKDNPSAHQFAYGDEGPYNVACMAVEVFRRGAVPAGPELTRAGYVAALQKAGRGELPVTLAGSFAPGKTDFADSVWPVRYKVACECYELAGPLTRARY